MSKRPLCLAAVLFLMIQVCLAGWMKLQYEASPSLLQTRIRDKSIVEVSGTIVQREERPDGQTIYLSDVRIRQETQIIKESKILVYLKQTNSKNQSIQKSVQIGNQVRLCGRLMFFERATNPGNFDRDFYYEKQDIHASVQAENIEIVKKKVHIVKEYLARIRFKWKMLLLDVLGEEYGNSMSAIMLGDKSELNPETKELYQKSGIGHVLAISGLHMSFLGMGLYHLLRKLGCTFWSAGIPSIGFLALYTIMIGGSISAKRALVMFIVHIGADLFGRDYDLATSLSIAAVLLTWGHPLYLFDAGFLLSFGALIGIAVIHPVLEKIKCMPKGIRAAMSINLALLPILLYNYFELPLYSMLLNLFVIPLMSLVLGTGILGSILSLAWWPLSWLCFQVCKAILFLYERAASISLWLPSGRIILGQPTLVWCLIYYILVGVLCNQAIQRLKNRQDLRRVKLLFSVIGIIFCVGCMYGNTGGKELKITMVDIGQGDCFHIKSPKGEQYLIDGGSTDVKKVGNYRMEPYLKSQGVGALDYVFVSHGDGDHINGIEEMLQNQRLGIRIKTLVLPDEAVLDERLHQLARLARQHQTRVVTIRAGQVITDGRMTITCIAPARDYHGEIGNASSMVLQLRYRRFDMIFTGDLEGEGEEALVKSGKLNDCDVLKIGHHGSKNSTSEAFLKQTKPEIVLISAGKKNKYGHPHQIILERLKALGSRVYCTIDSGAVSVRTNGKRIWVDD